MSDTRVALGFVERSKFIYIYL